MKTFGVLVAGWAVGGIIVVALAAPASSKAAHVPAVATAPARPGPAETRAVTPRGTSALVIPVEGVLASQLHDDFSQPRSDGRTHQALDILAPHGTPVIAAVDGVIRKLFFSNAGGITIYQFDQREERVYYYAHLDRYANGLAEGIFVRQGTVIGYVGETGNAHGTSHLHFAIELLPPTKEWWKGTPIDPYPLLVE